MEALDGGDGNMHERETIKEDEMRRGAGGVDALKFSGPPAGWISG